MKSATAMKKAGWRIAHTEPLSQAFVFEQFNGRRRVATFAVTAKSEATAWSKLQQKVKVGR